MRLQHLTRAWDWMVYYLMLNALAFFFYSFQFHSFVKEIEKESASDPAQKVWVEGNQVILEGETNRYNVDRVKQAFDNGGIQFLQVNSPGGRVSTAMDLAELMMEEDLTLIVSERCFSSCANYFIPAATNVIIKKGAVVGWHGGALQKHWSEKSFPWYADIFPLVKVLDTGASWYKSLKWKNREAKFYQRLGVNKYLNVIGQMKPYKLEQPYAGWNYDTKTLANLGLDNLLIEDGELVSVQDDSEIRVYQYSLSESDVYGLNEELLTYSEIE
jgi:hypothetical protein